MRWTIAALIVGMLIVPIRSIAQSDPSIVSATVPRLIQVSGVFQPADGQAASAVEIVTVSIYADADGGLPVWHERQTRSSTRCFSASFPAFNSSFSAFNSFRTQQQRESPGRLFNGDANGS